MRCTICDHLLPLTHRADICSECQYIVRDATSPQPSFLSDDESEVICDIT